MTIIGVLVPLAGLGAAVTLEMENEALMAATLEGGLAGRLGGLDGKGGATIGEGANDDPDAIVSVPANAPGVNFGGNAPAGSGVNTDPPPPPAPAPGTGTGTTGVLVKPQGPNSKVGNPAFIGNVGWVAPGTMTSMSNSIWQESQAAQNSQAKILLNSQAVVEYLGNQSATLTSYNDALLVNINTSDIQNLLSVLAGGSFIETAWSQAIFETALSADIVSREINSAWQSQSMGT